MLVLFILFIISKDSRILSSFPAVTCEFVFNFNLLKIHNFARSLLYTICMSSIHTEVAFWGGGDIPRLPFTTKDKNTPSSRLYQDYNASTFCPFELENVLVI